MRILIVEDNEYKLEDLKEILVSNFNDLYLDICDNLSESMQKIINNNYDYILLDMNFPLFKGEEINRNSGSIVLENIYFIECVDLSKFKAKIILTSSENYDALKNVYPIETVICDCGTDYSKELLSYIC